MQKGQIKGGITGDDLYLVQKDKEKDVETERGKLKKLEEKKFFWEILLKMLVYVMCLNIPDWHCAS
mgnify:CR=1 FL=1